MFHNYSVCTPAMKQWKLEEKSVLIKITIFSQNQILSQFYTVRIIFDCNLIVLRLSRGETPTAGDWA